MLQSQFANCHLGVTNARGPSGPSPLADPCRMRAGVDPPPSPGRWPVSRKGNPCAETCQADRNRPP